MPGIDDNNNFRRNKNFYKGLEGFVDDTTDNIISVKCNPNYDGGGVTSPKSYNNQYEITNETFIDPKADKF